MNKVWVFLLLLTFVYGYFSDNLESMVSSILDVPQKSLELAISIGGLIIIYSGIFQMAISSGVIEFIGKIFKPLSKALFPRLDVNSKIHNYICSNITANLLGLGIASTPMALKIISELKKDEKVTKEMITLLIINITSFSIFPLSILSIREKYNSNIGIKIWLSLIFLTFIVSLIAIIIDHFLQKVKKWDT